MRMYFPTKLWTIVCFWLMNLSAFAADGSFRLGYCADHTVTFEGNSITEEHGAAVYFPASIMGLCKGSQITELSFMVGSEGADYFTLFITTDLNKEQYDYEQEVESYKTSRWNTVILNQPYDINGDSLYIGYKTNLKGYFMTYTEPYEHGKEYILNNGTWDTYNKPYSVTLYATVKGDKLPCSYASLESTRMPFYTDSQTPLPLSGEIKNKGLDTLRNAQLVYTIDGEISGTINLDGLEAAYRETVPFSTKIPCLPEGKFDLQFFLSSINDGKANQDTIFEKSRVYTVLCSDHFEKRNLLVEMFSTEKCPQCPSGHKTVEQAIERNENSERIFMMTHHSGFYTDKYTIEASKTFEWFYSNRLFAPAIMLDRSSLYANNPDMFTEDIPIISVSAKRMDDLLEQALAVPAYASIELTTEPLLPSRELTIHVKGKELLPTNSNPRLFIFLAEDSLYSSTQSGGGKKYIHMGVPRQCLTETWGDAVSLKDGFSKTYTTVIADTLNPANMHVIAFVANVDDTDKNNCHIYNSAIQNINEIMTGMEIPTGNNKPHVNLNGRELLLSTECQEAIIYSTDGVCRLTVSNCHSVSLENLPTGMYIVYLKDNQTVTRYKIQLP